MTIGPAPIYGKYSVQCMHCIHYLDTDDPKYYDREHSNFCAKWDDIPEKIELGHIKCSRFELEKSHIEYVKRKGYDFLLDI